MITTIRGRSVVWTAAVSMCGAAAVVVAQPSPATLQDCARITQDSERLACFDHAMSAPAGAASGTGVARPADAASLHAAPVTTTPPGPAAAATSPAAAAASSPAAAAAAATTSAATPAAATAGAGITSAAAPNVGAATLPPEQTFGLSGAGIRKLEASEGVKAAEGKPLKELDAHIAGVSHNSAGRAVVTLDNGQVWQQSETRSSFEAHAGDAVKITPGALGSYWLSTNTHNWTRVERLP